ncbi:50S ribosomal protein L9 [Candidatus Saganbacteria bacterium CG08_land_8_20_14_0_20_45_16]|uniref:Large ribosomal subunit protein bL9 n=1 Tax=Candidatus Saganbacteria bacterium CG08_land_8_20_14_0_20_45_16 TaxID=2014293 RepID=A0A2H0Y1P0_UNCSA|nr:MAG: 50S ribosomal protein L9 [Candidatus Saganbacteria bacterium CG08_land_8_20_14_0_20_45_16]
MKVILYKSVPKLGEEGSVVTVSDGYARNYLLPMNFASLATPAALAALEKRRAKIEKKLADEKAGFEKIAEQLAVLELIIPAETGEEGKLFGAVTSQEIAAAIKSTAQIEIDKRKIELGEHIKLTGDYDVAIKLFRGVNAKVKVKVVSKE